MTEHIGAKLGEIASTVIMPGDPLRAKMIAEKYLNDYKLVSQTRNILAYTGYYNNKLVTVMASGMGMPSIGIYSYELYKIYGVENIIRVGTAGSYRSDLKIYDTVLVTDAYSDSSYALIQNGDNNKIIESSTELNNKIIESASKLNVDLIKGRIYSSDVFYKENDNYTEYVNKYNCLACEMESFALFHNAKVLGKKAACLITISNSLVDGSTTTAEMRQNTFTKMIEVALNTL